MRKVSSLIFAVVLGAAVIGCGGDGNGDGGASGFNDQAVVDSLNRSIHDINTENLNDLADVDLSSDFLDDCFDRDDFLTEMEDIFDDSGRDFEFTVDRIIDVDRTSSTEATVTYDWTITDNQGVDSSGTNTDFFFREGGEWRWAGNQECSTLAAASRSKKATWRSATK